MADRPTLVVVGAASRDLDPTDPRGWRLGGGVVYSSLAAARLGVQVRAVVGVDRAASTAHELDLLHAAGVDVAVVSIHRGPAFDNRQTPSGRVQYTEGPSDPIHVDALPRDWSSPSAAILSPVAGELGNEWASAFDASSQIALAAQGLVRRLIPGGQVTPLPLVRTRLIERAQMIGISAEDVASRTSPLRDLLAREQEMVVTHGPAGALYLRRDQDRLSGRFLPPTPKRETVDATGAGDVFLGTWVAARLIERDAPSWRALIVASAMASLSVEAAGPRDMPTTSQLCEVLVRLRDRRLD